MAKIKKLQESGADIYPVTHENAVMDNNGVSIGSKIAETHELINEVRDMFDGRSLVYLTQEEYDALSEQEKDDVTKSYIITNAIDYSHEHINKEFLDGLSQEVLDDKLSNLDAITLNGYSLWVGSTEDLPADENRDPQTLYFEIDNDTVEDNEDDVIENSIVNGILQLTADKYQKTNMLNGTTIVFPAVSRFTEIHLYFDPTENLVINLPDCRKKQLPDIVANKSYELVAIYNMNYWLVEMNVFE